MGYDASVYLIYGIRIRYDKNNEEAYRLMNLIIPDLIAEYGYDDVWSCFDDEPHNNGYYCLNFSDDYLGTGEIFIACWFHEHRVARKGDNCLEVEFPELIKMNEFIKWCKENAVEQEPKFYTKTYESC